MIDPFVSPIDLQQNDMTMLRTRAMATETGDSPFAVKIEMGAQELLGDEPVIAGGTGLGPNPYDLMVAALAE